MTGIYASFVNAILAFIENRFPLPTTSISSSNTTYNSRTMKKLSVETVLRMGEW
jgi:hypothetical protein